MAARTIKFVKKKSPQTKWQYGMLYKKIYTCIYMYMYIHHVHGHLPVVELTVASSTAALVVEVVVVLVG